MSAREHSASVEQGSNEQMAGVGGHALAAEPVQPAAVAAHEHSEWEEHGADKPSAGVDAVARAAAPWLPALAARSAGGAGQQGSRLLLTQIAEQPHNMASDSSETSVDLADGAARVLSASKQVSPILSPASTHLSCCLCITP